MIHKESEFIGGMEQWEDLLYQEISIMEKDVLKN